MRHWKLNSLSLLTTNQTPNMKKFVFTLCIGLLALSPIGQAQTTDVVTGILAGFEMAINGDYLYVAAQTQGKVLKVDLSVGPPTIEDLVSGLQTPQGLLLDGDTLYIAELNGAISKVDLSQPTPTLTQVVANAYSSSMAIYNRTLYFSQLNSGKISKVDLDAQSPTIVEVVTGLSSPRSLILDGDELYISIPGNDKISKLDLTQLSPTLVDVVSSLSGGGPVGIAKYGNLVYVAMNNNNKVSVVDLNNPTVINDVVAGTGSPLGLLWVGNDLFLSQFNKIVKIEGLITSVESSSEGIEASVYPNPANEIITLKGFGNQDNTYQIFDALGNLVKKGDCDTSIQLESLSKGLYFLQINKDKVFRFMKN